ncbi:MAG TPA: polysaccharide deacetylase, partial [Elusimicrobia bacterium]|nr:polysaccharide deacetylase [Elusimicrobiota bacterium]
MFSAVAVAAGLAIAASCRWAWWRPKIQGLPVLMYHKIGDAPRSSPLKQLWVAAADFRRQLRHLKGLGYAPLSFSELRDAELGKIPMPQKPVLITFDDGY